VFPTVSLVSVLEVNASCEDKSVALALAGLVLNSDIQVTTPLVGFSRALAAGFFFTNRQQKFQPSDFILRFLPHSLT